MVYDSALPWLFSENVRMQEMVALNIMKRRERPETTSPIIVEHVARAPGSAFANKGGMPGFP